MPRKQQTECIPLKLVQQFGKDYPEAYGLCEMLHSENGINNLPKWDKICYIPIGATLSIMEKYNTGKTELLSSELAAFASWRVYKEIYTFDKDFFDLLAEQADELAVPIDIIRSLPFPCIYIDIEQSDMKGYFVWIEDDVNKHHLELRFQVVFNNLNTALFMLK